MVKWFRKKLSDEEYVERARRHVRQLTVMRKPLLLWFSLGLVASVGLLFLAFYLALKLQGGLGLSLTSFTIGLGFGFMIGHLFHWCLFGIGQFLDDLRTRKLMIKYFDAIQELAASERGLPSQETIEHTSPSS